MVVKVGGHDIRMHIISRVLYRSKRVDILSQRQNDDSTRVLAGAPADTGTSLYDPVDLAGTLSLSPLLKIIFHKSKGRLIRQSTNGAGPICLTVTEDNLCILVRIALVVSGKVQVNIRLLVSLKPKECLKGDIKPVFYKFFSAHRAILVRHIHAAASGVFSHFI